jgi:hypothetical protein
MRERSWFQVIQKIFRVFQNQHVIHATTRVNSFTIFMLSCWQGEFLKSVGRLFQSLILLGKKELWDEILANHRSFMTSLNFPSGKESQDIPYLYWIPKLHKTPYKESYINKCLKTKYEKFMIYLTKHHYICLLVL